MPDPFTMPPGGPQGAQQPSGEEVVDVSRVTASDLGQRHDEYDAWRPVWDNYRLLFRGGEEFLRAAGQAWQSGTSRGQLATAGTAFDSMLQANRRRRFLYQFEAEPDVKYYGRLERAHYVNYMSAIINYFRHWLFSHEPIFRVADDEKAPEWFAEFAEDCTGGGKNWVDFVRDVFLDVLLCRRAGWLIGGPQLDPRLAHAFEAQAVSLQAAEAMGARRVTLTPFAAEEITDWQCDAAGRLQWVVLRKTVKVRQFPRKREQVEFITYADRQQWATWRSAAQGRLELIGHDQHGAGDVPFCLFELPADLWVTNQIAGIAVEIFNRSNALKYGETLSCYPQPYVVSNDPNAGSRVMGDGIIFQLRPGRTGEPPEDFGWKAPPTDPYRFVAEDIQNDVREMYRVVHQMAMAIDASAASALDRSGASKAEDRRATEIILRAFGGYVRETMTWTLNFVQKALAGPGGTSEQAWVVDGYDTFGASDLKETLEAAAGVQGVGVHSLSFMQDLEIRLATSEGILPHLTDERKEVYRQEIIEHYDRERERALEEQIVPPDPNAIDPETGLPYEAPAGDEDQQPEQGAAPGGTPEPQESA